MIYKNTLFAFLFFLIFVFSSVAFSQATGSFPALINLSGYYQHPQNKELYLQMKLKDDQLLQIRDWDGKEMLLDRQSKTDFSNSTGYNLSFQESKQEISAVKIGLELWVKAPDYVPEKMPELSIAQLSNILDQKAAQLVRAINTNDMKKIDEYLDANFSSALKSNSKSDFSVRIKRVFRSTAGVKFNKRLYFNPNAFFAEYEYISEDLNNVYEFSLKLDKDLKVKLYNSRIIYSSDPLKKLSTEKDFLADLDTTLQRLDKKEVFSGTVLLAKADQVLFEYASGSAIKESNLKNTSATRFNIGSMNKMFTAVGVMQLIEKGKLNLNDPVSKFLDSTWLPTALANKVEIRHLLNHSAGLGDFFNEASLKAPLSQFQRLEGYKPFVQVAALKFEPGNSWSYSNSGMLLLGVVIEKVSGQTYEDYIEKNIFKPAGMLASSKKNPASIPQAVGYVPTPDGKYKALSNSIYVIGSAAGGGYSSTGDLHKFGVALLSGKLLNDNSKEKLFKDELGRGYGYGFQLWDSPGNKVVGHGGGAPGVSAMAYFFPKTSYMIIVLSNYDRGTTELGDYIFNQLKSVVK